jgi:hypothetical protein
VKTTYEQAGSYGGTEVRTLYCHHNHGCDIVDFYEENGEIADMVFESWSIGKDKWDAMKKLWSPFVSDWGGKLLDGVEYYTELPKKQESNI